MRELRQLRRFLLTKMKDFTKIHVEDKLGKALEAHKNAAKKWGIATLPSSISVDCEASIVAGMLMAAGVIGTGMPLSIAAATGAIVPLAQAMISINRGRKSLIRNSDVRYLVRLENEAGS